MQKENYNLNSSKLVEEIEEIEEEVHKDVPIDLKNLENETKLLSNLFIEDSKQPHDETLKQSSPLTSTMMIGEDAALKLLAWCSKVNNTIGFADLNTQQMLSQFDGVQLKNRDGDWTHVREILGTRLLVSLHYDYKKCANMEIFDISNIYQVKKIFAFEEVIGIVGEGDITYNSRRNILGAMSLSKKISYHLFNIDTYPSKTIDIAKLNRKSMWHPRYSTEKNNIITGLDFNSNGDLAATVDSYGVCMILDINTHHYSLYLKMGGSPDDYGRCRWSTNSEDPLLYVKYSRNKFNILDVEKKAFTIKDSVQLEAKNATFWIDVSQKNGNLMASGGWDRNIKIYDRRESKALKIFDDIHSAVVTCVRWNSSGDMLATASWDKTAKVIDFKTGKILFTGITSDDSNKFIIIDH